MERPGYLQNAQRLLEERALAFRCPENAILSLPMTVRTHSGELADAVFAFDDISGRGRPFAWAMMDMASGEPVLCARCEAHDFVSAKAYPLDMNMPLTLPQSLSAVIRADARRELLGLYERIRPFALAPLPTREQRELIARYSRLFEMLVYREHRPFYRALGSAFLDWLGVPSDEWPPPEGFEGSRDSRDGEMSEAVRELSMLFRQKIETDEHKQRLFDEMHSELQQYKNDLYDTMTRPLEGDVIKLIDDIEKSMEAYRSRQFTPDNYRRLLTLFEGVGTDLTDLLYRHGVEPFSQEGDEVVIGRQKILATLPTTKRSQDKKVAVRHSKGWEKNGKIIRPERITVYLYTPPGQPRDD